MTVTIERPAPALAPADADPPCGAGPRIRRTRYEPLPGEPCLALPLPPAPPPAPIVTNTSESDGQLASTVLTVLRLLLEVLDGRRPASQLTDQLTPAALRYVRATGCRGSGRGRLSSLRICRPATGIGEVAAVYRLDGRARAVAARFERSPGGAWSCVALRLG